MTVLSCPVCFSHCVKNDQKDMILFVFQFLWAADIMLNKNPNQGQGNVLKI